MIRNTKSFHLKVACQALTAAAAWHAGSALAAPSLDESYVRASQEQNGKHVIVVEGSGFGEKKQAAPVLLDRVESTYENGAENLWAVSKQSGDPVLRPEADPTVPYAKSSTEIWSKTHLRFDASNDQRSSSSKQQYYFPGGGGYAGWPRAYGGNDGTATPVDDKKIYVAWWYKPLYSPNSFWLLPNTGVQGTFVDGETVTVGEYKATFIGVDSDDKINLVFQNSATPSSAQLIGQTIRGTESNASLTFPSRDYGTPGSQKYIRIWEDPNGREGIRFSWTQMHQTFADTTGENNGGAYVNWSAAPIEGGKWHLLEVQMDTGKGEATLRVNTQTVTKINFDPKLAAAGKWSPTIGLVGLDGKSGRLQKNWLDDIYFDNSFQRVVLGNAPAYDQVTHYELQRPTSWKDDRIEFVAFKGGLKSLDQSYIYVFDENGLVNQQGIQVCSGCKAPPSPVNLRIK